MARFDWRSYAQGRGMTVMDAWIAVQKEFRYSVPGKQVTSPRSLDELAGDEAMRDLVRAIIDDAVKDR